MDIYNEGVIRFAMHQQDGMLSISMHSKDTRSTAQCIWALVIPKTYHYLELCPYHEKSNASSSEYQCCTYKGVVRCCKVYALQTSVSFILAFTPATAVDQA